MHQSIPPAPSTPLAPPPPGYCRAFAHLVSLGGGVFANFALPGARAFAKPRGFLSEYNYTQKVLLEKTQIGSSVKDRNK